MREMGVEIRCGVNVGEDVTLDELREQGFAAFYVAIGCQGGRRANVVGEDAEGVSTAVDFLRTALENPSHEVSGRTVVVGGGNVAIDAARVSVRCRSNEVTMVCLEQRNEMPALPHEIAEAEEDGVAILNGWGPARIEVGEDGRVCGVTFKICTRVYDESLHRGRQQVHRLWSVYHTLRVRRHTPYARRARSESHVEERGQGEGRSSVCGCARNQDR